MGKAQTRTCEPPSANAASWAEEWKRCGPGGVQQRGCAAARNYGHGTCGASEGELGECRVDEGGQGEDGCKKRRAREEEKVDCNHNLKHSSSCRTNAFC